MLLIFALPEVSLAEKMRAQPHPVSAEDPQRKKCKRPKSSCCSLSIGAMRAGGFFEAAGGNCPKGYLPRSASSCSGGFKICVPQEIKEADLTFENFNELRESGKTLQEYYRQEKADPEPDDHEVLY